MESSGLFWIASVILAIAAIGFVATPLLKANRRSLLLTTAIAVPLLAAGLYMQLGSPGVDGVLPRSSMSQRPAGNAMQNNATTQVGSVASLVDGLANRLRDKPEDGGSWLLLARSYKHLGRFDEAAAAYRKAAALGEFDAELADLDSAADTVATGAQISGRVQLSPDAASIVQPTDTVFVFAKAVHGPAAPIAVLQRSAADLPIDFLLDDSQSMIAGVKLSNFEEVVVTARVTRDGNATVALRGLEAKSGPVVVTDNRRLTLTIK